MIRFGWPEIGGVPPFTPVQVIPNVLLLTDYWLANIGTPSWSLSIEEQFYLLVPLLLYVTRKFSYPALCRLLLGFVSLGLLFRLATYYYNDLGDPGNNEEISALNYFPFHTRMDPLALGVLLALLHQAKPDPVPTGLRKAAGIVGLLLVGMVFFNWPDRGRWFKLNLQFSCVALGFGAILWSVLAVQPVTALARFLSWRSWVPVARLSYSLYLTHLVAIEFTKRILTQSLLSPVIMLVGCIVVALPLFLWVEEPLHQYARRVFQ